MIQLYEVVYLVSQKAVFSIKSKYIYTYNVLIASNSTRLASFYQRTLLNNQFGF